ncbi:MAG: biosynthetic-type acetolactate synthase large subunit [Oscillospiraceae bacterium]|nr:biosynthetic-type acetolactate synthase large subunit [Oscillospiraceae bacterium]
MMLNGSDVLVECLLEQGVGTVFGYPGGAVLNIYDALYKYRDRICHVLTAHEQGASHAADGYARATGRVGVCIATSGPGATNLVTGIATAYMDSIPIVAITGNVSVPLLGRDSFQEVDITGITMPVTKHNFIVKDVNDLAPTVREAFRIAQSGRPGPVLIDIPKDVTAAMTDYEPKPSLGAREYQPPKEERLVMALEKMESCSRPLIYFGGGILSSGAQAKLLEMAEKLDIPVCSSMMGLGGFPPNHPLWLGMVGMHGTLAANRAAHQCDLLLVLGARFSDRVAGNRSGFSPNSEVVHIDVDHAEFDKNITAAVRLAGDLKEVLAKLCERSTKMNHTEWVKSVVSCKRKVLANSNDKNALPDPLYILQTLRALIDDDTIIATDVGQHQMWTAQHFDIRKPRTFLTSGGLGTMGYGLGAAIGAQLAKPEGRVVLISGDGSFHMNLNELTTLASYNLPIVVLVMNNSVLGMVRQWQKVFYDGRFSATDPHRKTDLVKLAEAFGCKGMRISKNGEVEEVLKSAIAAGEPVVVDCRISPDANVLPMIPPGGTVDEIIENM